MILQLWFSITSNIMTLMKIKGNLTQMDSEGQKGELSHNTTPCPLQEELSVADPKRTVNRKGSPIIGPYINTSYKNRLPQQFSQ